jgi:hypothetical protein
VPLLLPPCWVCCGGALLLLLLLLLPLLKKRRSEARFEGDDEAEVAVAGSNVVEWDVDGSESGETGGGPALGS